MFVVVVVVFHVFFRYGLPAVLKLFYLIKTYDEVVFLIKISLIKNVL